MKGILITLRVPCNKLLPLALHAAKLTVVLMDYLEIFDGGLSDAAVEVEDVALGVVVPDGRLVLQFDELFHVLRFVPFCSGTVNDA